MGLAFQCNCGAAFEDLGRFIAHVERQHRGVIGGVTVGPPPREPVGEPPPPSEAALRSRAWRARQRAAGPGFAHAEAARIAARRRAEREARETAVRAGLTPAPRRFREVWEEE